MKFETNFYSQYVKQWLRPFGVAFIFLISLTACSQNKTIQWREETKLSNGKVIVVERKAEFRSVYAGGTGNGWLFQHARIKAVFPDINKEVAWEGGLVPLAIDEDKNGDIYLVGIAMTSQGNQQYSIPNGMFHAAFKFNGVDQWIRIPVETVPLEFRPNLLIGAARLFIDQRQSTSEVLDLELKEKANSENYTDEPFRHWPTK